MVSLILPVEDAPVGDHDDGIEDQECLPSGETDQLVRQPGDGVALAAARRVLNQVAPARAVRTLVVGQQPAHYVELMVAGPDLGSVVFRPVFLVGP